MSVEYLAAEYDKLAEEKRKLQREIKDWKGVSMILAWIAFLFMVMLLKGPG